MDEKNRVDEGAPAEPERIRDQQTSEEDARHRRRLSVRSDVRAGDGNGFVGGGGSDYP